MAWANPASPVKFWNGKLGSERKVKGEQGVPWEVGRLSHRGMTYEMQVDAGKGTEDFWSENANTRVLPSKLKRWAIDGRLKERKPFNLE